jgi:DNA-binding response OmpR family regulator
MHHPQIVVYETDGWLASQVSELARENRWLVRESRRPDACLGLLRSGGPALLMLKLERKLIDELALLCRINECAPECPVIVFSDVKLEGSEQRTNLAGLAYDLGARHVLFPPLTRPIIEDLVIGLMTATIRRGEPPEPGRATGA